MGLLVYPESSRKIFYEIKSLINEGEVLKGGGTTVYLVRFRSRKLSVKITKLSRLKKSSTLLYLVGPSKGYREFKNVRLLKHAGFNVPEPLMYWEIRKHGVVEETGFVEEYLDDVVPVRDVLSVNSTDKDVLKILANTFRRLHDAGFFMRDLTFGNFFLSQDHRMLYIIDVSRMVYLHISVPLFLRFEDLSKVDSDEPALSILMDFYWGEDRGISRFSANYVMKRKQLRRIRKRITHKLKI